MTRPTFNPALTTWLNDKDYVSCDWPDNVVDSTKTQADNELAPDGFILDRNGWPVARDGEKKK